MEARFNPRQLISEFNNSTLNSIWTGVKGSLGLLIDPALHTSVSWHTGSSAGPAHFCQGHPGMQSRETGPAWPQTWLQTRTMGQFLQLNDMDRISPPCWMYTKGQWACFVTWVTPRPLSLGLLSWAVGLIKFAVQMYARSAQGWARPGMISGVAGRSWGRAHAS